MVAMLAIHSIRLKNFASLEIGRNLVKIDGWWWIVLSARETKESRPTSGVSTICSSRRWIAISKSTGHFWPGADQSTKALWLSSNDGDLDELRRGRARASPKPLASTGGVAVSPHLFRTAVASSAAIHGGAYPNLASALLHHTGSHA